MGGGLFQFCSAVTEKPAIPMHQMTYSFTGVQPSSDLSWPVLIVAHSVIACFFAAFATGYAFFLSWDKHMVGIFAKEDSKDNLLMYDSIESSRNNLCDRCRPTGSTECSSFSVASTSRPSTTRLQHPRCCQLDYCCPNAASTSFGGGGSQGGGSSSSSSAGYNYAEYSLKRYISHPEMGRRNCARCVYEHNCKRINDRNSLQSRPTKSPIVERQYSENCEETRTTNTVPTQPIISQISERDKQTDYHQQIQQQKQQQHQLMKAQFYSHASPSGNTLRVCNDPICQREQMRYQKQYPNIAENGLKLERPNSADPAPIHSFIGDQSGSKQIQQQSDTFRNHSWTERRNNLPNVVQVNMTNSRNSLQRGVSFDETEHLYSNYYQQKSSSENYPSLSAKVSPQLKSNFPISISSSSAVKCNCCENTSYNASSFNANRGSITAGAIDYFSQSSKENISSSPDWDFNDRSKPSLRYPGTANFSHHSSYSTLPAKFPAGSGILSRESFSIESVSDSNKCSSSSLFGKREYKSCLNINEDYQNQLSDTFYPNRSASTHRRSYSHHHHHGSGSWRKASSSSVPSLKAQLSDSVEGFDGRKVVKTVTFITPEDEDDRRREEERDAEAEDEEEDDDDGDGDDEEEEEFYFRKSIQQQQQRTTYNKTMRQDLAVPDGSSENSDVYDGARLSYR